MNKNLENKNIWIFHHYATPPTMNGFTRPYDFGVKLLKHGIKTTVFSSAFLHFSYENLIEDRRVFIENNETSIPHVFIKTTEYSSNGMDRVVNMLSFYKNIFKVTKKYLQNYNKPDFILASSPHLLTMIAGIKIAKKLSVPIICEVRDFWPEVMFMDGKLQENSLIGKILLRMEYWIYKKADALIFLKEGDYKYLIDRKWTIDNGGEIDLKKVRYINNGVDIKSFTYKQNSYTLEDEDLENNKFKVIYTGAIRPVNNVGSILDAAKLLSEDKDIEFLIYGNGSELEKLQQRVEDENINNVKFKGYVHKKYIPFILSRSSVNLLNYSQEKYNWSRGNSSNKLFEYMASGKPIISTVKMGYSIIEKYNCGIELENYTSENLASSILKIKSLKPEEYNNLGKNAKYGARNYDYNNLTIKLIEILKQLKGNGNFVK